MLRQKKFLPAKIGTSVGGESALQESAKEATQWTPVLSYETAKDGPRSAPHTRVVADANKVLWPNSRYKVEAKAEDGRAYPSTQGVVRGLSAVQEQRFSYGRGVVSLQTGGQMLPSARAWIQEGNLYVSEPATNPKMISQGKAKIALAESKERTAANKQARLNRAGQGRLSLSYEQQNVLNAEIALFHADAAKLRQEGGQLISMGQATAVNVVSAGAYPTQAHVTTSNDTNGNSHAGVSDAESGYLMQRIAANHKDQLQTTVQFPSEAGRSVGSARAIAFDVPSKTRKPAFEMNGVKYYAVKVKSADQQNDPPAR